jgi:tetratricopeptide (TPR) repeat protein
MQDNENQNVTDKINDFVTNHRKAIFTVIVAIIVLFIGLIAYLSINDAINKKAITELDELNGKFDDLALTNTEEDYNKPEVDPLLADIKAFAEKTNGFAGCKAWAIVGQIYSGRKDWANAQEAWLSAVKKGNKTYLAPIALFNAAAAAEELGNPEKAVELLEQCVAHKFEFPAAARAQFSIGRLHETLGNNTAAVDAYRVVLSKWPQMPVWQNLARSRIAVLEDK